MPARAFYILVHFFAVLCKTTTSNNRVIGVVEKVNARQLISFSLFEIKRRYYEFNSLPSQKLQRER